ncbi:GA-like domain-containing protein [Psychrobacter lutiphocae]|uniref:GA-like domain-containing protein n=1 Tax=Psychrobacter lutiphocae TaxID=540500 RepID=UPI0038790072
MNDLTDAQNKVAAAEEAQREAEQALKDAEANGSITQQEHDELQDLQDKVVEAKQAAQEAINLLDPSKDKEGLQAKLGEVDGIVVPEVTDSTGDGLDDTLAQQVQDAIDVFKDAEQAAVMPCIVMVLSI